ncbi:MAG TPA: LytTR family DNA-binding domain-containing protein [Marmoricola sp.]|nr:LytTR family DNA-binding domain-containing protein [Marmoricola sp.]
MNLTVLAVDDEQPALDELAFLLDRDPRVEKVVRCRNATDALKVLQDGHIDALFVDIAMPGLSGLELASVLKRFREAPPIVFVTAHAEKAVDAFELNATDYLLKPIREERLQEALRRIVEADSAPIDDDKIPVELGGITRFVQRSDVLYVEAQGDYSRLHTGTGHHLVRIPISTLEERWSEGFVRIHRSYLVAMRHIDEVRTDAGRCSVVIAGRELGASRRMTPMLRDLLRQRRESS